MGTGAQAKTERVDAHGVKSQTVGDKPSRFLGQGVGGDARRQRHHHGVEASIDQLSDIVSQSHRENG